MELSEAKKRKRGECSRAMQNAKDKVEDILKTYGEHIEFQKSDIYIMSPDKAKLFIDIEDSLEEFRQGGAGQKSVRKKAYSVNKIVNLINPNNPAYQYDLTIAKKYVYLSTKDLCLKEAGARVEISANIQRKNLKEEIDNHPEYSSDFIEKLIDELEKKIEKERERVKEIISNPTLISSIKISSFKSLIEYGQINYGYLDEERVDAKGMKVKVRTNAHLSINYPNVFFYEPIEDIDEHRSLMVAKYLEELGYIEICKDVFVKYANKDKTKGEE